MHDYVGMCMLFTYSIEKANSMILCIRVFFFYLFIIWRLTRPAGGFFKRIYSIILVAADSVYLNRKNHKLILLYKKKKKNKKEKKQKKKK
jgi:hypothetical protein